MNENRMVVIYIHMSCLSFVYLHISNLVHLCDVIGDWKAKDRYVYIEYISTNNVNPVSPANYFLCYAKSESANDRAHAKKLSVAFISNLKVCIGNKALGYWIIGY